MSIKHVDVLSYNEKDKVYTLKYVVGVTDSVSRRSVCVYKDGDFSRDSDKEGFMEKTQLAIEQWHN